MPIGHRLKQEIAMTCMESIDELIYRLERLLEVFHEKARMSYSLLASQCEALHKLRTACNFRQYAHMKAELKEDSSQCCSLFLQVVGSFGSPFDVVLDERIDALDISSQIRMDLDVLRSTNDEYMKTVALYRDAIRNANLDVAFGNDVTPRCDLSKRIAFLGMLT